MLRGPARWPRASQAIRRFATKKAAAKTEAPKADMRQLAAQREREQKRQHIKRENARALLRLKDEAREFQNLPHTLDITDALRYIRAAEVGRPAHATTLTVNMRIVADRGVPKVTGACRLPKPLDEERICVVTNNTEHAEEARRAGAAMVGSDNIINAIREGGPINFDRMYATPDIMSRVTQIARILGPRGLMPNVKRGTVTTNIYDAIVAARGEMTFKQVEDSLNIPVARASFTDAEVVRNVLCVTDTVRSLLANVQSAKKGTIGRTLLSSTESPSIAIIV